MISALRLATNPVAIWALLFVATGSAFKAGSWVGYSEGKAEQKAAQAAKDAAQSMQTVGRVRDALDQINADTSDDAVNSVLRGLSGQ